MNNEYMIIGIIIGLLIAILLSKIADVIEDYRQEKEARWSPDDYSGIMRTQDACGGMYACVGGEYDGFSDLCKECADDAHQAIAQYNELTAVEAPYEPNTLLSTMLMDMWSRDFGLEQIQRELNAMGYDIHTKTILEYFDKLHVRMLTFLNKENHPCHGEQLCKVGDTNGCPYDNCPWVPSFAQ